MRKKVIFGNWKMNGTNISLQSFLKETDDKIENFEVLAGLALPYTLLDNAMLRSTNIEIVAQNVHFANKGAFTGEISIDMLKEIGIHYVLVGHSERRQMFNETNESVNKKAIALLENNMTPVICVGETLETREENQTIEFVNNQIKEALKDVTPQQVTNVIVAYEPIWAIGTGKTATAEDAQKVCESIRETLGHIYGGTIANEISILYGGSVTPQTISELMSKEDIDGALVGGASLKSQDYLGLINYEKKDNEEN